MSQLLRMWHNSARVSTAEQNQASVAAQDQATDRTTALDLAGPRSVAGKVCDRLP
jgi:hypothetical protein